MKQLMLGNAAVARGLYEAGNLETDIMVYPGHNDPTTIETERMENPYL